MSKIYNTIDTLPLYLLQKIEESNDFELLVRKKKDIKKISSEELVKAMTKISEELQELQGKGKEKQFEDEARKNIVEYKATFWAVKNAIIYLKGSREKDEDLINVITKSGYFIVEEEFDRSLDIIEKQINNILNRIESEEKKMKKDPGNDQNLNVFEAVAVMNMVLGVNLNPVTVSVRNFWVHSKLLDQKLQNLKSNPNG